MAGEGDAAPSGTRHTGDIPDEAAGARLDKALAMIFPALSRSRLKQLVLEGRVFVEDEPVADPSVKVTPGQTVSLIEPPPAPAVPQPEVIPLNIVYEDAELIVVDKPAGMVVHPAPGSPDGTLVNALLHHCADSLSGIGGVERPGIVHRIDKETSGLLVVAKTDRAHQGLSALFAEHTIERAYWAFVRGAPKVPSGTIDKPIARSRHDRKKMAIARTGGRDAVTHYRVIETYGAASAGKGSDPLASLVECHLETGRTHQIRVHLADFGYPVLGDPVYGRAKAILPRTAPETVRAFVSDASRQALHARMLGFTHPVTQDVLRFESPLPPDLQSLRAALQDM